MIFAGKPSTIVAIRKVAKDGSTGGGWLERATPLANLCSAFGRSTSSHYSAEVLKKQRAWMV